MSSGTEGVVFAAMAFLWLVAAIVGLLLTAFWIWMLVDCATKEPSEGNDKLIWVLVIVLAHGIGAIVYYFARRPHRIAQYGR